MAYPRAQLAEGEEVAVEFRPHWSRILREVIILAIALVAAVLVAVVFNEARRGWALAIVVGVALVVTLPNIVNWLTSDYTITNQRVISRRGFLSSVTREVPLDVINTVAHRQNAFERIFDSGDLLIESAGSQGQNVFHDIVDPEHIKGVVYRLRNERLAATRGSTQRPSAAKSVAEELAILADLYDRGRLSEEEYEAEKARTLGRPPDAPDTANEEGPQ